MKNLKVHFSSKKQDWETPQDFFDKLNEEFHFNLDVCASDTNHKCNEWFDENVNGLEMHWFLTSPSKHIGDTGYFYPATCWMNPPYGREIGKWVKKAYEESRKGCTVVCLLPARTDTKWYHTYIYDASTWKAREGVEIRQLKGRLKFVGAIASAPFPSMVVIFRPPNKDDSEIKEWF